MKRFHLSLKSVPLALLALSLLSYAPLSAALGIHWDDWPSLWFLNYWGPTVFPQVFSVDRPVQGWLFILTTGLLGDSMFAWQIFGILVRCLGGLMLWLTLRALWPNHPQQVTWVAFLFLVYPGFTHQYIPITYSHILLILALFLFSLYTMLLAQRQPRRFWPLTLLSLAASAASMITLEYYVGLELLRPVLLWMVQSETTAASLRQRLLRAWLPYTLPLIAFVAWRLANPTPRAEVLIIDHLLASPFATLRTLFKTIFQDMYEASLLAWSRVLDFSKLLRLDIGLLLAFLAIVLVTAWLAYRFLTALGEESNSSQVVYPKRSWGLQAILVGLFALAVSGLPIWSTELHMELAFPWDRFTLPMMLGVSLIFAGLVALLASKPAHSLLVISLATGLAAGAHFRTALGYQQDWQAQKAFFWQLAWRAPHIQPGTALLTTKLPFTYSTDNSLTAPLNWIYANQNQPDFQLAYLLFDIESRLGGGLPSLEPDQPIDETFRIAPFHGDTSQVVLIIYQPPDCLRIVEPSIDLYTPNKPSLVRKALPLSRPELVSSEGNPDPLVTQFFGPEPKHDWCYYFEKADLARQAGDWQQVAELGSQVINPDQVFAWRNTAELALFIEGFARTGRWTKAVSLTQRALDVSESNLPVLCALWERLRPAAELDAQGQAALQDARAALQCPAP
ncbi:MAG: hypothetical protein AB1894_11755 [Chloroflexota bacterium]